MSAIRVRQKNVLLAHITRAVLFVILFLTLAMVTVPNCPSPGATVQPWQHLACRADRLTMPFLDVVQLFGNFHAPSLTEMILLFLAVSFISYAILNEATHRPPWIQQRLRRLRWLWSQRHPFALLDPALPYFTAHRDA